MQTIRTPEKSESIRKKLAQGYSVAAACRVARISRSAYYAWCKDDPEFAAECDDAIEEGTDRLEDIAMKRAIAPKDASDTLLIFLLKGRRPEKYRERSSVEHSGSVAVPIQYVDVVRPPDSGGDA